LQAEPKLIETTQKQVVCEHHGKRSHRKRRLVCENETVFCGGKLEFIRENHEVSRRLERLLNKLAPKQKTSCVMVPA
jgi:transposase